MDPKVKYLLSLGAVRERAKLVEKAAHAGKLRHFDVHEESLSDVADFVSSVIKVRLDTILGSTLQCKRLTSLPLAGLRS